MRKRSCLLVTAKMVLTLIKRNHYGTVIGYHCDRFRKGNKRKPVLILDRGRS